MRVLLVDDNKTFLSAARALLLRYRPDFMIDIAADAETAIFAIRTHEYEIVVSDLILPGADGIQLLGECARLRTNTPVILISGYGDAQLEQRAAQAGAYAFLHKPVDPDAFVSVVNRALVWTRLRRRPELALGDDSLWYSQAMEQTRRRSSEIAARLQKTIKRAQQS